MRLLVQHRTSYAYPTPAQLGPHTLRVHPAPHVRAGIEAYRLDIAQPHKLRWQRDPAGNRVARADFTDDAPVSALDILVEIAVELRAVNPFDFLLDEYARQLPFAYPEALARELAPCLALDEPAFATGPRFDAFDAELPRAGASIPLLSALNLAVHERVRYVIREEAGVFTPETCLVEERASCRDSAVLLCALLRRRGLAARFVSGYLIQLADEGMLPDQPRGVSRDVVDLHAWCEVFLPGAGWIGLDATSGLLCGEGHIALCGAATPSLAAPLDGTSNVAATGVSFSMDVRRLGHEPSPTTPYTPAIWDTLRAAGDVCDGKLLAAGLELTVGGEPTFNGREHPDAPEWNSGALGAEKAALGLALAEALRTRLAPGAVILHRHGKWYPGESLPRWALEIVGRKDGAALWPARSAPSKSSAEDARRFAVALAKQLGLADGLHAAYEDPWQILRDEAHAPPDDALREAKLDDPESRRRLVRLLGQGVRTQAGWVLPLQATATGTGWWSERWRFRREELFLLPGDSPLGLRLPLASLPIVPPLPLPPEEITDPRREAERLAAAKANKAPSPGLTTGVRSALCIELRDGILWAFLPPLPSFARFRELIAAIDAVRAETSLDLRIEGYPPPRAPDARTFSVTPDPGVLEVNVPPSTSMKDYEALIHSVFDAALEVGLHAEKYLLDGRMAGSGGGNHITLGGPSAAESPFLLRPALLASLLTFVQHHPCLSYLFAGLFVGPTSQAPRVDEARHDSLYELELALAHAFEQAAPPAPWLSDRLFRNLLVDMTGNTHRAEISIDKLYDPQTSYGRQGLVELRAFEMPPHPRMVYAQVLLARALIASFTDAPYQAPLVRWGASLHDRFLLPHALWSDLRSVLHHLAAHGVALPEDGYVPFMELRCPLVGTLHAGDVTLELRNAIEPWHVLGEELTAAGTSRFVDSSMERIEVRTIGLVPGRHVVMVNGHHLPMHASDRSDTHFAGVRFRAWAPPHSLHPHLGIHHPIRLDVVDTWAQRSLGGCAYHVWHPEGRAFISPPLTRFEAAARRSQRFTSEGPSPWPVAVKPAEAHGESPYTLDLRRFPIDFPPPANDAKDDAPATFDKVEP